MYIYFNRGRNNQNFVLAHFGSKMKTVESVYIPIDLLVESQNLLIIITSCYSFYLKVLIFNENMRCVII